MFDLFTKSVEFLLKLLDVGRKERDQKMKREFGEALVTAYLRLLEVISTGKKIVGILENAPYSRSLFLMSSYLREQAVNLLRWDDAIRRMRPAMRLLSPDLQAKHEL